MATDFPTQTHPAFTRISTESDIENIESAIRRLELVNADHPHYLKAYRPELVIVAQRLDLLIQRVPE